ncbi:hypothetical protein [Rhodophyticola porphyridii]|uniref:hypothetical protein n=1 Tax=Rhodophyticola porphyridii TaxID=1852017 RepID=UPI0035D0C484
MWTPGTWSPGGRRWSMIPAPSSRHSGAGRTSSTWAMASPRTRTPRTYTGCWRRSAADDTGLRRRRDRTRADGERLRPASRRSRRIGGAGRARRTR